ncbi:MAG TPA: hypothetical protein VH165_32415 [Kofleriaceae bacterium]|nr:hypothetical protein [Kofleriaceae bacterium]
MLAALAAPSRAGTVAGKLELPPAPERPPVIDKGFLDRTENPLAEVKKPNLAPYFVVALEGDGPANAPGEVTWDLVGESFARPVIAVPVGAQVVIRNQTKISRTIGAVEDPKLLAGPLNPTSSKSFRAAQPAIYTIHDPEAPHLRGKIVVVATAHVAAIDDAGRFELADVPDGSYKLRIFYYDPIAEAHGRHSAWLPTTTDVTVASKGKIEVTAKVSAADLAGPAPGPAPGKK